MNSKNFQVVAKVYQNNSLVAEASHPLKKRRAFFLSNKDGSPLSIPFYPFDAPVSVFEVKSNAIHLNLGFESWKGFLSISEQIHELKGEGNPFQAELKPGDYASLVLNDLMVIFKISAIAKEKAVRKNPKLSGSFGSFFFENSSESQAFLGALAISILILIGFYIFLGVFTPPQLSERLTLDKKYTLPFISPDHLFTAPEALKENLDRSQLIDSTTKFYSNLSLLLLGLPVDEKKYLYPSSLEIWGQQTSKEALLLQNASQKQKDLDLAIDNGATPQGLVRIPSVRGKPLHLKLSQALASMKEFHAGLELIKDKRREIVSEFQKDPEYNWYNYINPKDKSPPPAEFEGLSKIKVFSSITNEASMYLEARKMSIAAKRLQQKLFLQPKGPQETVKSILVIPQMSPYASFISNFNQNPLFDDSSLARLPASRFTDSGAAILAKVREPLIGRIDPKNIKNFIGQHQAEINICYEIALRKTHNLSGFMSWKWVLSTSGRAQDVVLTKSTVNDRQFLDCVQKKVESWRFPPPKYGSVIVNHTFRFKPLTP